MNCREFQKIVAGIDRPGELDDFRKNEALRHAGECDSCAWLLSRHDALSHAFEAVKQTEMMPPIALEERLLQAFRRQGRQRSRRPERRPWLRALWPVPVLAANLAAAVLLIYLIWPWQVSEQPHFDQAIADPVVVERAPVGNEEATGDQPLADQARGEEPPSATVAAGEAATEEIADSAADLEEPQYLTDFIPTMYLGAADSAHEVQLVRVRLPRSSLASFGFEVDPRRLEEPVKADLLVGTDGLTRAIRFVVDDFYTQN
jgi:hypothetical protein